MGTGKTTKTCKEPGIKSNQPFDALSRPEWLLFVGP